MCIRICQIQEKLRLASKNSLWSDLKYRKQEYIQYQSGFAVLQNKVNMLLK